MFKYEDSHYRKFNTNKKCFDINMKSLMFRQKTEKQ
jgi:hypothetical protein